MMQTLVPGLLEWGVPDDADPFRGFRPRERATRQSDEDCRSPSRRWGCTVRFARRDAEPLVWPEQLAQTLLELAEQSAGVPMEAGCRVGNCGRLPGAPVVDGAGRAQSNDPGWRRDAARAVPRLH